MGIHVTSIAGMGTSTYSSGTITNTGMGDFDHMHYANDFVDRAGVLTNTDYVTTQNGSPNMSVNVSAGIAYIINTAWSYASNAQTKFWRVVNDSVVNATVATSDGSNPRIDLVCIKVNTGVTPDGTASNVATIISSGVDAALKGTPAVSPVAPTAPSNYLVLAQVRVNAGVTSIVNANITSQLANVGAWLPYSPSIAGITVGNGAFAGGYKLTGNGKTCVFRYRLIFGSTTTVGGSATLTLPFPISPGYGGGEIIGMVACSDSSSGSTFKGVVPASAVLLIDSVNGSQITYAVLNTTVPFTWTTNDQLLITGMCEIA